jgi:hypothetical protein
MWGGDQFWTMGKRRKRKTMPALARLMWSGAILDRFSRNQQKRFFMRSILDCKAIQIIGFKRLLNAFLHGRSTLLSVSFSGIAKESALSFVILSNSLCIPLIYRNFTDK